VSSIDSKLEKNIIVAIAICGITLFLALLIIFMIFLLRRQQAENKNKLQESQESESQRTSEGQEAGFIKVVSPVYYPPTYTLQIPESNIGQPPPLPPPPSYTPPQLPEVYYNPPKYNTIQRSTSVQVCVLYLRFMY
jgi:cytoskeletal protein RodZ